MSKDPAFLFYPNDYIGGTMGMTFEEKGAYIELLMLQFNRGHMTSHMIGQTVGQLWDNIKDKFVQDSKGLWYNERLDLEKDRRKRFTDSRKNNLEGKNQYTKKQGHTTPRMEDEDVNEDFNENVSIIVDYLNKKAGKNFKISATGTKTRINARMNEGYKVDDFKKVIDIKVEEWGNTDMDKYLRPDTLFSPKFESYLNQKEKIDPTRKLAL